MTGKCFSIYGFEYKPGFDNSYITWVNTVRGWTVFGSAFGPDAETEISARSVPEEPMVRLSVFTWRSVFLNMFI
jgi:hypothetical protein